MQIKPGLYVFGQGRALAPAERASVLREIAELDRQLATAIPPNDETIVADIAAQIFASFKARDNGQDEDRVYDGFLLALTGRVEAAAREAVRRLVRNEAPPQYSRIYVHTAAELAALTMSIEAEWGLERKRLVRLLDLGEAPSTDADTAGFSDERMAKMRARAARLEAAAMLALKPRSMAPGPSAGGRVAADLERRKAAGATGKAGEPA